LKRLFIVQATVRAVLTVGSSPHIEAIHGIASYESRAERAGEAAGGLAVVELKPFCLEQGNGRGVLIQNDDVRSPLGDCAFEKPTVRKTLTVAPL